MLELLDAHNLMRVDGFDGLWKLASSSFQLLQVRAIVGVTSERESLGDLLGHDHDGVLVVVLRSGIYLATSTVDVNSQIQAY